MAGIIVPIVRYEFINWSTLVSQTQDLILADQIPVGPFAKIGRSARLHKVVLAASVTMQFIVKGINPSDRDGGDFVFQTDLGSTPTFSTTTSPIPQALQLSTIISDCQQPMVRVILRTIAGATSGVNQVVISADLMMRESG